MLTNENHFKCDLQKPDGTPDCDVEFYYDPGTPQMPNPPRPAGTEVALMKIVATVHARTQYTRFYCCDAHASEGIKRAQHLPPTPSAIHIPASAADVKAAVAGAKAVTEMKAPAGRPS